MSAAWAVSPVEHLPSAFAMKIDKSASKEVILTRLPDKADRRMRGYKMDS